MVVRKSIFSSLSKLRMTNKSKHVYFYIAGLCHLHSLCPPALHNNFKTANVLVDENFIAKVADAGMSKLLEKIGDANPSSSNFNAFKDPE